MTDRRRVFRPECGHTHWASVTRDPDGYPVTTFDIASCSEVLDAKERAIDGMVEHGAEALALALEIGDSDRIDEAVAAVLARNDGRSPEPPTITPASG